MRPCARTRPKSYGKPLRTGLLALASLGLLLVLAGIGTFIVTSQTFSKRESQYVRPFQSLHWAESRASDARRGERVIAKIIEKAQRDPIYRQTILRTTKQDIWSLNALSDAEKAELWDRNSTIQDRLRRLGMEEGK